MSNTNKELATELLIKELERRMYIIQSETTELREQMITHLVSDLSSYVEIEQKNIEDAFDYCSQKICTQCDDFKSGVDYFIETFKND